MDDSAREAPGIAEKKILTRIPPIPANFRNGPGGQSPRRSVPRLHTAASLLLAVLLPSCSLISANARQNAASPPSPAPHPTNTTQASNAIVGTGAIAMSTLRATAVAAVHRPVHAAKLGFILAWERSSALVRSNLPANASPSPPVPQIPGTPEFEALLDSEGFPHAAPGRLALLIDGTRFFPEFERLVRNAGSSIDVQIYIFDNDDTGVRCADMLKARAAQIPVRVLFDDIGTSMATTIAPATPAPAGFKPPADMLDYLRANSKTRVRRTLNPWLVADHTKLIVIDRSTALLGGMNLGREYFSEWHDLMVRIDGPVVAGLQREFDRNWRTAGPWGGLSGIAPHRRTNPGKTSRAIPLRILKTDAANLRHDIMRAIRLAIRASRKRVWIETPYFASDEIAREAEAAARRGVDVRVVIPSRGDSNIMDVGNLATAHSLIQAGARVFRYPGMTHAKVTLCDGWATLGSANLDILSMRINRELNIAFSDPAAIRRLEKEFFAPDFEKSRLLGLKETEILIAPVAESIADQL
jgi:cardiolipin synthase